MSGQQSSKLRTRWAAIGAAVAITLGAGGVGITNAVTSSDARATYTAIAPCRLADTRPGDQIGLHSGALGPGQHDTHIATGDNGDCAGIPADVVSIVTNTTAVEASEPTYLSLAPGSIASTGSSNLNVVPGQPPTPNAATIGLDGTGRFNIYNHAGNVHYIIDVVGYHQPHDHDDLYLTQHVAVQDQYFPDPLVAEHTFTQIDATVTTTRPGRLLVTKSIWGGRDCSSAQRYFFLMLDGVPIPSSAIHTSSASISQTLTGVTADVIAPGEHVVSIGLECAGPGTVGGGSLVVTSHTSITVLPG